MKTGLSGEVAGSDSGFGCCFTVVSLGENAASTLGVEEVEVLPAALGPSPHQTALAGGTYPCGPHRVSAFPTAL